jgi:ACR3 family arsenite transporter
LTSLPAVIIWNQLSGGDKDLCVLIVAVNSMAQLVLFAPYTMIFVVWLGAAVGIPVEGGIEAGEAAGTVAVSVAIYLGIPMAIGFALWWSLRRWKGMGQAGGPYGDTP